MLIGGAAAAAGAIGAAARWWRAPKAEPIAGPFGPLLEVLGARGTFPVNLSPAGRHLLLKALGREGFELRVVERDTGRVVASATSADTQLAPTWRDDGRRLAFLQDEGGDGAYRLYVWSAIDGGARRPAPAPPTTTTALRWAPRGERLALLHTRQGSAKRELVTVDLGGGLSPTRAVIADVAPRTGFVWSPDGERLAAVERGRAGAIAFARAEGGPVLSLPIAGGLEPRALAWSPDGRSLLVTGRAPGEEFSGLYEIDVAGGGARALAPGRGADLSGPLYAGGGATRLYHENADGELHLWALDSGGARRLGPAEGNMIVSGLDATGAIAWVLYTGRARPPTLLEVPIDGGPGQTIFASERRGGLPEVAAERADVEADDGLRLPLYVWRAAGGGALGALVRVHGGVYSQSTRGWQQAVDVLVAAGVHVVSVNFRGSAGYGARYEEAPGGDEARARDVLWAAAYARDRLGVPEARVWLWGHSHGALIASIAAALDGGRLGGLVAVSATLGGTSRPRAAKPVRRILGFHGAADPSATPEQARAALGALAGGPGGLRPTDRFEIFAREGHNFSRGSTWQRVYGVLLGAMGENLG